MTVDNLIALGNQSRESNPEQALGYYAQAFAQDRNSVHAFNNYGNVLREIGDPAGAVPFLQRAIQLDPGHATAQFNLAVAYLLLGNYAQGWPQYETRWNFEHMAGTLPAHAEPRWTGQDLSGKTILIVGEQGHGDNIQFVRFLPELKQRGACIILQVNANVGALFAGSPDMVTVVDPGQELGPFDYWAPIMSLPGVLGITLETLPNLQQYLIADANKQRAWLQSLGPKHKLRVGFCWSGRRDTWINQHKGMNQQDMLDLIRRNPNYDWINLQIDATADETQKLVDAGVVNCAGTIHSFADTAALVATCDVVISVDTAIAHLAGAMGRPTWIMLNAFAVDWRWLLGRDSSPWYPTARLFRQPVQGDWASVTDRIDQYLSWFKV